MKTQLERARAGEITPEMEEAARYDDVCPEFIREGVARGLIVLYGNPHRKSRVVGIGRGLRTKVNASIGTSPDIIDIDMEVEKARTAQKYGADTLMELSTGGDLREIRRRVLDAIELTVGTVPLYQAAIEAMRNEGAVEKMDPEADEECEGDLGQELSKGCRKAVTLKIVRQPGKEYEKIEQINHEPPTSARIGWRSLPHPFSLGFRSAPGSSGWARRGNKGLWGSQDSLEGGPHPSVPPDRSNLHVPV